LQSASEERFRAGPSQIESEQEGIKAARPSPPLTVERPSPSRDLLDTIAQIRFLARQQRPMPDAILLGADRN